MLDTIINLSFVFLIGAVYFAHRLRRSSSTALPPGPAGLPIIGNVLDLPPKGEPEYKHWLPFKDKYGLISSVTVLGQTIVLLHSRQAVIDILENTSSKTSGRPNLTFASMCDFERILSFKQYTPTWRKHRKMLHQEMGTKRIASQFQDVQDRESRRLLFKIIKGPQTIATHIKTMTASIILKMTYGYNVDPHQPDPLVDLIERMMDNNSKVFVPMSWVVDILPCLRYLPSWLPGMGFKTTAQEWRKINHQVADVPYNFAEKQLKKGENRSSYVSKKILEETGFGTREIDPDVEEVIKWSAAIIYGGGADTTAATISAFFLAMAMFPDVQKTAQREIDTVVGSDRLPGVQDQENLPYISALIKETLRWFPLTPMGVGHLTDDEVHYEGYVIPKHSVILPATWWLHHDPEVYSNPDAFEPERFLPPREELDPRQTAFGYGRRTCPGRFLADVTLFLTLSRVLSVFTIRTATDALGKPIEVQRQFLPGLVTHLAEFPLAVVPRSRTHKVLIEEIEQQTPWESGDIESLNFQT